jgi:hypothetical protein
MAIPLINIGSKLDGKGFKQAETATDKLGKQAKKLAGALGLAFGTAQVIAYGKNAVKAFAENEKSAKRLEMVLKNLGLAFDTQTIEKNLGDISAKFGYEGEVLREAFQKLVTATGSTTKSQELLNLSLDVAAGSGEDLLTVNQDLAAVYVGNTKGLRKYNLGLSQTELKTLDFNDAVQLLSKTFAGSGTAELETFSGQMRVLSEAANNAQEIIGGGLIESFNLLAGDQGIVSATEKMETFAQKISDALVGATDLLIQLGKLGTIKTPENSKFTLAPSLLDELAGRGKKVLGTDKQYGGIYATKFLGEVEAANAAARAKADAEAAKRLKQRLADQKKALDNEKKAVAAKRLANAIDKANLLLNKGEGIFDLEKIQIGAALANQADQLGKITNQSQMLAIANDVARLNVKKSMLELEDAIAAKDEAAIIAATAKLNADLKILGALNGQSLKLTDIKSILDSLKPKDLINITNLNEALAKIQEMLRLLALANTAATAKVPTSASLGSGIPVGDYIEPISKEVASKGSIGAILEYAEAATARANAFAELQEAQNIADELALNEYIKKLGMASSATTIDSASSVPIATAAAIQSGNRYAAQAAAQYEITINAGYGTDPEALARTFEDILNQSGYRGTSTNRGSGVYIE